MSAEEYAVVRISQGSLRGRKASSVRKGFYYSFQGIPYAKAPIGNLRFKAPVEAEPWTGVRDALKEGPVAPSHDWVTRKFIETSSEDCLFLNVYTAKIPADGASAPRPVMFWIHGGAFNSGSGSADMYGPDYLVTEDVVLVTCNYRLGALGFLSLESPECPGNNGLKDLILALKWVRKNIAAFGGDPGNVTIFGESAGGAAVHYLMLTKKSEGLFHKAIAQSGVATNPWAWAVSPREKAFKLGEVLGCKTTDEKKLLEFLRGVKPEDLVAKSKGIMRELEPSEFYLESAFLPCVEPDTEEALLTRHPDELNEAGEIRRIPFMLGWNTLEGLIVVKRNEKIPELNTDKELERLIPKNLNVESGSETAKEIVEKIRKFYFPKGFDEKAYVNALSQIYFLNGINQIIEYLSRFSRGSSPTYLYKFVYDGNVITLKHVLGFQSWKGTLHADELSYLFKQNLIDSNLKEGTADYSAMENLTKIWTDFAKTGKPAPGKEDSWAPISANNLPYAEIDLTFTQKTDFDKTESEFWNGIHKLAMKNKKNCKL